MDNLTFDQIIMRLQILRNDIQQDLEDEKIICTKISTTANDVHNITMALNHLSNINPKSLVFNHILKTCS